MSIIMQTKNNGERATKQTEMVTKYGQRKINVQNMSRTVVLPKGALSNCGCNLDDEITVDVELVQNGDQKFIRLIPGCNPKTPGNQKEVKK